MHGSGSASRTYEGGGQFAIWRTAAVSAILYVRIYMVEDAVWQVGAWAERVSAPLAGSGDALPPKTCQNRELLTNWQDGAALGRATQRAVQQ